MLVFTGIVIAIAIVLTLALAASSSSVSIPSTKDMIADDDRVRPLNRGPKLFSTTHQGVGADNRPVVSAAGMQ